MKKVSVIIPTYKRSRYISRAIESVVNQDYKEIEIIVVDDNGKDTEEQKNTQNVVEQYDDIIYIVHEKNSNGSHARNTGINVASGEYICFLDDDDIFDREKIIKQVKKLDSLDSEWGACYTGHKREFEDGTFLTYLTRKEGHLSEDILSLSIDMCSGSTIMIRKEVIEKLKGFDESFKRYQDIEFVLRVSLKYKIAVLNEALVTIYTHTGSNKPKSLEKVIEVKKYYLEVFKKDINKLSSEKKNKIYFNNYIDIAKDCVKYGEIKKAIIYAKLSGNLLKAIIVILRDSYIYLYKLISRKVLRYENNG